MGGLKGFPSADRSAHLGSEKSRAAVGKNEIHLESASGGETRGEAQRFFGQATFSAWGGLAEDGNLLHTGSKERAGEQRSISSARRPGPPKTTSS